jgi:hypothetical protein
VTATDDALSAIRAAVANVNDPAEALRVLDVLAQDVARLGQEQARRVEQAQEPDTGSLSQEDPAEARRRRDHARTTAAAVRALQARVDGRERRWRPYTVGPSALPRSCPRCASAWPVWRPAGRRRPAATTTDHSPSPCRSCRWAAVRQSETTLVFSDREVSR